MRFTKMACCTKVIQSKLEKLNADITVKKMQKQRFSS